MNFCRKVHNTDYYVHIEDVPEETWNDLGCTNNLYFSPKYLSAIANNHSGIDFLYVVLHDDENSPIAFATIQVVDFLLDSVQNELKGFVNQIKKIGRKFGIVAKKKPFKILTCGNTFVSGEHGIFIKNNQNKQKVIKELAKSVVELVNDEKQFNYKISGFMLKDFIHESLFVTDELLGYNYHSFNVEPNMLMQIDSDWNDFTDYLAAMKTKFRVKAKKAMEKSFPLEVIDITQHNFHDYAPEMETLYKNVSSKAGFNLGSFNLETYNSLKEKLGEDYVIRIYLLKDKVVGYLSAMINQKDLDAHYVGIDYTYNREFAIYQRMLYDYIQLAIDKKLSQINFGRTASEIKSSVGAEPQNLTIYFRHKNHIPNKIFSFFVNKIQPTPFNQKFPFKVKNLVAHN
ncbi:GNAT family N-acetyltransferase [Tenacibaculum sp. SZ-18]|uniref:peptidogalycan biosysnthesis protein n=1 Tax=Tenacibaculum sp. SZ-18 TaxID=754423 RepID=UPI000C2D1640|nr:peptidogalycan biosysnthesis protein [Tenacibaculum sp. SZ-18]AUC16887.1 GNAT family N-acetyltransferase [Tenacibaculum sp. SZ-18]